MALNRLDLSGSYCLANGWQHLPPLTQLRHLNLQCVMLPGGVAPPELAVLPQLCIALRQRCWGYDPARAAFADCLIDDLSDFSAAPPLPPVGTHQCVCAPPLHSKPVSCSS
jgi:hypothetical protein